MRIENVLLPSVHSMSMTEWQFIVGALIGVGAGVTLSRNGIVLTNPETRWQFVSFVSGFAGLFGLICGLMNG
jgi:hypothetical protein